MNAFKDIALETPIAIGGKQVASIRLRKPTAGELRGVKLLDLLQMEVGTIEKVLPRITDPMIGPAEFQQLDAADLTTLASEVSGFLAGSTAKSPTT